MDLSFLNQALTSTAPVATVYADLREPVLERDAVVATRREAVLRSLAAAGCPDATIGALRAAIAASVGWSESGLFLATGSELLARVPLDREVPGTAAWGMAHLSPLILQTPEPMTAAVVLVDGRQAQIHILRDGASAQRTAMITAAQRGPAMMLIDHIIAPADLYTRKTTSAGWFALDQKARDHGVENAWQIHARSIASAVLSAATEHHVDLIAIAGDVHHRTLLADMVRDHGSTPVHVLHAGGPAPWLDLAPVRDAVIVEMAVYRTAARGRMLEAWQEGMHPRHAMARQGIATTLAAIREQRVSTLLLTRDAPLEARGVVGEQPWLVGMDPAEIDAYAPHQMQTGPLCDLAIRAVALAGGQAQALTALPPSAQGMAALLRWA